MKRRRTSLAAYVTGRWRHPREQQPSSPPGLMPHSQARLLAERAVARGIEVRRVSTHGLQLRYGATAHHFRSGGSSLNSALARRCTRQKEVTSLLLRHQGIPAPESTLFRADDLGRAWAWAEPILPVVIKPNAAAKGTLVRVGINDKAEFAEAFTAVGEHFPDVLVEEFVSGNEHRFAVVDGAVVAITQRKPPLVEGDGNNDLATLIEARNLQRQELKKPLHTKPIKIDAAVLSTLHSQGMTLKSAPAAGESVWLRRTTNISLGGEAIDRTDEVDRSHVRLVERAAKAIPGLRLAGFDVLLPRQAGGTATVLEVNSRPMLSMHTFPWQGQPRNVFDPVPDAMFPQTALH